MRILKNMLILNISILIKLSLSVIGITDQISRMLLQKYLQKCRCWKTNFQVTKRTQNLQCLFV